MKFAEMVSKALQYVTEPPGTQKATGTCPGAAVTVGTSSAVPAGADVAAAVVGPAVAAAPVVAVGNWETTWGASGPQAARAAAPAPNPASLMNSRRPMREPWVQLPCLIIGSS